MPYQPDDGDGSRVYRLWDDDKGFSAEQIAYFEKNLEFIREKKY